MIEPQSGVPGSYPKRVLQLVTGIILIAAALVSVAMVVLRLQSATDHETVEATFTAVRDNFVVFVWYGAMRVIYGVLLLTSGIMMRSAISIDRSLAYNTFTMGLTTGGAITVVSGLLIPFLGVEVLLSYGSQALHPEILVSDIDPGSMGYLLEQLRTLTGKIGFTLTGGALLAFALATWRNSGVSKLIAPISLVVGGAMMLIWWDAATVLHRITGAALFIWTIATAVLLMAGGLRSSGNSDRPRPHRFRLGESD